MRLFFALPLPEELRIALADWQGKAKKGGLKASYPRAEGLHLTLVFLGTVAEERLPALGAAASGVASQHGPFHLGTSHIGVFPPRGFKVVWLGVEPSNPLTALQDDLAKALAPLGFSPEDRGFSPHITVARPKGADAQAVLPEGPPRLQWAVPGLALYESLPDREGQRYEVRGHWTLGA